MILLKKHWIVKYNSSTYTPKLVYVLLVEMLSIPSNWTQVCVFLGEILYLINENKIRLPYENPQLGHEPWASLKITYLIERNEENFDCLLSSMNFVLSKYNLHLLIIELISSTISHSGAEDEWKKFSSEVIIKRSFKLREPIFYETSELIFSYSSII